MLDDDACYRALTSRDRRHDGRFFVGVRTTGIYCRPICPAPTPRRRNVRFFTRAAAAAEAGFRPCLRCRPESAPGTPAWQGTHASVARALRLIDEGALDRGSVADLADRLGLGERHLRRLFQEHVGVSPVALAQTRRLHFAKRLLDETDLPMTEVAFAAGYASLRRFNATVREVYGRSPRELRALRRRSPGAASLADEAAIELRLAFREPFDWPGLLAFLEPRATPGVERVEDGRYRRSVRAGGAPGVIEVERSSDEPSLRLRAPARLARSLPDVVERVRRLFDLGADPHAIRRALGADRALAPRLRAHPGVRIPGAWDGFELAVRVILGQQVSVPRATELAGKLTAAFGAPLPQPERGLDALFPEPEALARADIAGLGLMPAARANAIRRLAAAVVDDPALLEAPESLDAARETLGGIAGIGPWTVEMIAMRALGDPDAFPAGDLGLRRTLAEDGVRPDARALEVRSQAWRPWRAYGALALWRE